MGKDKSKLIKHLSANTLQVLGNQCLGVFIFLLISRELDKPSFGGLSWALAVLTLATTLLSLRLEQIVARNVAAGDDPSGMLTLFAAHNFFTGLIFFGVLSFVCYCWPGLNRQHYLLWMLSISQVLTFWALPFRQLLTGRSAFGWLAMLASISNLVRATGLYIYTVYSELTLHTVIALFTISSFCELALGVWIVCGRLKIRLGMSDAFKAYIALLRSSLPQMGVVFLNAGIARIDWILLGFLSTPAHTAEYTFAYRAFEFAPLPLLVLAPFLLNRFARGDDPDESFLRALVRVEMVLATLPVLWLVIMWAPVVDVFTNNKYGEVNAGTFLILACCIPFQYLINLYWSHAFARNRLVHILSVTAVTGAVVLTGDVLLIPAYAGQGAALVYLAAMVVQYALYARNAAFKTKKEWGLLLLLAVSVAACSGLTAVSLEDSLMLRLVIASALYCLLGWLTGLLKTKEMIRVVLT